MSKSSNYGQGTIDRYHNHPTCPPAELVTDADGKARKVRPHHDCQGPYRGRIMVTVAGKRVRKTVYGKTRALVVTKLRKVTVAEGTGTLAGDTGTTTVEQWMTRWFEKRTDLKQPTRVAYEGFMRRAIFPALGSTRLDRLSIEDVEDFYDALRAGGLSEGTVHNHHTVLNSALKEALRKRKIGTNPCALVTPPAQNTSKDRTPLTIAEAWRVLDAAGDDPRWWVALLCGVRQGEALALTWADVELDAPVPFLTVNGNLTRACEVGTPKTTSSTGRVVPLVEPVVERLRKARDAHLLAGGTVTDSVFTHGWDVRQPHSKDYMRWTRLLKRLGIEHRPLHAARNTTAVLLEDAGVSDRAVAAILGHANVRMTHHYQKRNTGPALRAGAALDAFLTESTSLKVVRNEEEAA